MPLLPTACGFSNYNSKGCGFKPTPEFKPSHAVSLVEEKNCSKDFELTDAEALQLLIALGHPARFEIFRNVMEGGQLTTAELNTGKSPSTTSHHLKKLVGAGVLGVTKSGKEFRYCARSEVLFEMGR